MVDGVTEVTDHEMTESNRKIVKSFVDEVLIQGDLDKLNGYINQEHYVEHNPKLGDDIGQLKTVLSDFSDYKQCHRLLAEGNFVLSVCEGYDNKIHTSFFDLYRIDDGKIVEHWDTTEAIPLRSEWKNSNGKF